MLKFLCICLMVALGAVLSIPMEMTTLRPEATTEDTSGRLLTLPDPVKCENSEYKTHIVKTIFNVDVNINQWKLISIYQAAF